VPPDEAERALRDLDRVYRWLRFGAPLRRAVLAALAAEPPAPAPWVLDLGAGGGHVATDLATAARRRGRRLRVVGLDAKLSHLLAARRLGSPQAGVVAEAAALPLAGGAVACSFSHLFFHHLEPASNRRVLEEMRRVSRRAVVVLDLRKSLVSRLLVRPCLRLLALSPTAFDDGVASVRSAYGTDEVAAVAAGLPVRELRGRFPFRWSLVLAGEDRAAAPEGDTGSPAGAPGRRV
jgi:SAM-dependent methyltransferase